MVMQDHICPFGLKTLDLLKREGYEVKDRPLKTREEVDELQRRTNNVETTPQKCLSTASALAVTKTCSAFSAKMSRTKIDVTYVPVIALFTMAAGIALAASWGQL